MLREMKEEDQEKCRIIIKEIFSIFEKHGIKLSEASGILGAMMGVISSQTEENFPFVSFFNSLTRSYHANYEGEETHDVTDTLFPCKE